MIIVDDRDGSRALVKYQPLRGLAVLSRLDFGDVMLSGNGPANSIVTIGVEVKSVTDLLSSIASGRLAGHQIPGMLEMYDHCWLLIFGEARPNSDYLLEVKRKGGWKKCPMGGRNLPWSYLEGWLLTVQMKTPMRVKWVTNVAEAATWLAVYDRWLSKTWDEHKALAVFNRAGSIAPLPGSDPLEAQMALTAASLPSMGYQRGWAAARHFNSIAEMVGADVAEWKKVDGVGPVIAKAVTEIVRRKRR